ncbi:hypothetical protein GZH53_04805 [Flavihumibacter sp. R14]|nr:hypothetical protein [Flavihumibacter soli]
MTTFPEKIDLLIKDDEKNAERKSISQSIKEWLIPVSTVITLLSVSFGIYQSLLEYNSKLRAESILNESQRVEINIKLVREFSELMRVAQSRRGTHVSETAIGKMFDSKAFTQEELKNGEAIGNRIEEASTINLYVGEAEQAASIAAITELGLEHSILLQPAIEGLKEIKEDGILENLTSQCLAKLEKRKQSDG